MEYNEIDIQEKELADRIQDLRDSEKEQVRGAVDELKNFLLEHKEKTELWVKAFLELSQIEGNNTPDKKALSIYSLLAMIKNELLSVDVFADCEDVYEEYLAAIYRLSQNAEFYFSGHLLERYLVGEREEYDRALEILDDQFRQENMIDYVDFYIQNRVKYMPKSPEIQWQIQYACDCSQKHLGEYSLEYMVFLYLRAAALLTKYINEIRISREDCKAEYKRLVQLILQLISICKILMDQDMVYKALNYLQAVIEEADDGGFQEEKYSLLRAKGFHLYDKIVDGELSKEALETCRKEAKDCLAGALALAQRIFGNDSSQAENIRMVTARLHVAVGEASGIDKLLERLYHAQKGEDEDYIAQMHALVSEAYEKFKDYDRAIYHYQFHMDYICKEYGAHSDMAADYYGNFAAIYERAGKYGDAVRFREHALANYDGYLLRTTNPYKNMDTPENLIGAKGECEFDLGHALFLAGRYEDALTHTKKALDIYGTTHKITTSKKGDILQQIGGIYEKIKFPKTAFRYYMEAWDVYQTVAEFNSVRQQNQALFAGDTKKCLSFAARLEKKIRVMGYEEILKPVENILYDVLSEEEREFFISHFAMMIRRRTKELPNETIWKLQFTIYQRILNVIKLYLGVPNAPAIIEDILAISVKKLDGICKDDELEVFCDKVEGFLDFYEEKMGEALYSEENSADGVSKETEEEGLYGQWEKDYDSGKWYIALYPLRLFMYEMLNYEVDFMPFSHLMQTLCSSFYAELFETVYTKEEKEAYEGYEQVLRREQAMNSEKFSGLIMGILQDVKGVTHVSTEG